MSSFFTLPSSKNKRKRSGPASKSIQQPKRHRGRENDSISGSDGSEDEIPSDGLSSDSEDEEHEDEDPATKRVRLAEQYLANIQREVVEDEGFDAAEIDRENLRARVGERLKQDTAESKGKLYRWLAADLDWQNARTQRLRSRHVRKSYTGVAVHGRYVFAVSKDIHLVKWELPETPGEVSNNQRMRSTPKIVASTKGNTKNTKAEHHHGHILCIAVSQDGKFLATGGVDKKLIVWDPEKLQPLKVFTHHRDSVTALAFRRGSHQLYSASKDRTVKIWSLDELSYVETLFGHQDQVTDIDALAQEQCVTVGARDRTARLWKVVEESQLVFRGGGAPSKSKAVRALKEAYGEEGVADSEEVYHEGSIDCIAVIDDDTFVTASDSGSISLWDIRKKKPVYVLPLAHGLDPPLSLEQASADIEPDTSMDEKSRGGKHPRWITALQAIPFSDTIISGSWDGYVRVWKISQDKRRIEALGAVTTAQLSETSNNAPHGNTINGIVSDLAIVDRGERAKDGVLIAAAVGKEHRLGAWDIPKSSDATSYVALLEVRRKAGDAQDEEVNGLADDSDGHNADDFEGFD